MNLAIVATAAPQSERDEIKLFASYMRAVRGVSENTAYHYSLDLKAVADFISCPLPQASRADLQRYISHLLESGKSAGTASRRLTCLRGFYRYLLDEEAITTDPTRGIPLPKQWKRMPRAINQQDCETLVASLGNSWVDVRDRAVLLTLYGSGLRVSELLNLRLVDVDLEAGVAKVWNGKGGKDGIVPLSPRAVAALREYIATVRPRLTGGREMPWLFLSKKHTHLSRVAVWYRIHDVSEALGRNVSPHAFRHGFATALIEGGADVRDVQVLMRHSSVETTQIYIHTDMSYLRRIYRANHPRAVV